MAGCESGTSHTVRSSTANAGPAGTATSTASVGIRNPNGYGRLIVDGKGNTLYLFTIDRPAASRCDGACAKAWPPFIVSAAPSAGAGVQAAALAVTRRADGTLQAAYLGHPLYYFQGDTRPGQINCQDAQEFGGHWWLVKPNGQPNRATP